MMVGSEVAGIGGPAAAWSFEPGSKRDAFGGAHVAIGKSRLRTRLAILDRPSSRHWGERWGSQIAFDAIQGGAGLLGSVAVNQGLPGALRLVQNLARGGFPVERLRVLIPPVQKLSNVLFQCRGPKSSCIRLPGRNRG